MLDLGKLSLGGTRPKGEGAAAPQSGKRAKVFAGKVGGFEPVELKKKN